VTNDELILKRKEKSRLNRFQRSLPKTSMRLVFIRDNKEFHTCLECKKLKQFNQIVSFKKKNKGCLSSQPYNHVKDCSQKGRF
jgi:hypothetical protein